MAIVINGNGIDMGGNPVSNASQIDSTVINESGSNVRTENDSYSKTEVDGKIVGFKNYIINGNFDVWQRGTSQTSSEYGSDDRWPNATIGSTKTHSRVECTDTERALFNATYYSRTVVTSVAGAGNGIFKQQRIENIHKLAGKTVTLSFWAKADNNKKLGISSEVLYGTGGSPSPELAKAGIQQILDLTTVWKKFTITVTLPTAVGKTLGTAGVHTSFNQITFWFDAGSAFASAYIPGMIQQSGTFDIAQVQLEEGSVATPFEQRPYGIELMLCQRYYYKMLNSIWLSRYATSGYSVVTVPLPTAMRAFPTITQANNQSFNAFSSNYTGNAVVLIYQLEPSNGFELASFTASSEL